MSVVTVDPLESFPVCLTKRYLLASKLGASSIAFPYPDGAVANSFLPEPGETIVTPSNSIESPAAQVPVI